MPQTDFETIQDEYTTIYDNESITVSEFCSATMPANPMPQEDFSSVYDDYITVYDEEPTEMYSMPTHSALQERRMDEESAEEYETE